MEHCAVNRRHLVETVLVAQISEDGEATEMNAVQALVQVCSSISMFLLLSFL